jgi:uncharacterized protein (DUF2062 family)/SAM-dependent methyltransferase
VPTRLQRLTQQLLAERSSPARLGWAVALGVMIGTTPLYGLHLVMAVVTATLLRLNRAVTYLAANIPVPIVQPVLAVGSIQLGTFAFTGEFLPLSTEAVRGLDPWSFGAHWLLGSLMLGALLGAPLGLTTFVVTTAYRRRHPLPPDPIGERIDAVAARYRPQGPFVRRYVRGKLELDPVTRQLAARAPFPPPLVDLGCGRGQTVILLALLQPGLPQLALDWDERKLASARQAVAGLDGIRVEAVDVRDAPVPRAGTILLIDVLHYNPPAVQDRMLRRAAAALVPGGVLYVREADADASWRMYVTHWQERIGGWLRMNRGATLCFRPARELMEILRAAGLQVSVVPSREGLPFSNVLIEARRLRSGNGKPLA